MNRYIVIMHCLMWAACVLFALLWAGGRLPGLLAIMGVLTVQIVDMHYTAEYEMSQRKDKEGEA